MKTDDEEDEIEGPGIYSKPTTHQEYWNEHIKLFLSRVKPFNIFTRRLILGDKYTGR